MPELTETFTRDIAQYVASLPLHNTGAGIAEAQPDPSWQFVRDSHDPNLNLRPAIVVPAIRTHLPNTATSRWGIPRTSICDGTISRSPQGWSRGPIGSSST